MSDPLSPDAREARAKRFRAILYRMYEDSGMNQDVLAPAVNLSPKDFSRAISPTPHPDAEQRRRFPGEQIANYSLGTSSHRFFEALADELGYDPARLHEIRRQIKTKEQIEEERNLTLDRILKEVGELRLEMQDPGQARKPARRR